MLHRRRQNGNLGIEHDLLGILDNEDGTVVRMLARMEVSPEALDERMLELRRRQAD
jgi:hypothetical protein